jgi:hypothetical protein
VDILNIKIDFPTLMDVIIANSTRINMVQQTLTTTHATMIIAQEMI